MKLIAFTGLAQTGKTTAANFIPGAKILSFADPVKQIAYSSFGWDGVKDEKGRRLLQIIGTECGRAYDKDIWVKKMRELIAVTVGQNDIIAIDDCRFDNEPQLVRELGGIVIEITRPGCVPDGHASEAGISPKLIDFHIFNNGTLEQLREKVLSLIAEYV
jgi:dephospho-CoA kinase